MGVAILERVPPAAPPIPRPGALCHNAADIFSQLLLTTVVCCFTTGNPPLTFVLAQGRADGQSAEVVVDICLVLDAVATRRISGSNQVLWVEWCKDTLGKQVPVTLSARPHSKYFRVERYAVAFPACAREFAIHSCQKL